MIIPINAFDHRHSRCRDLILSAIENDCEVILVVDAQTPDDQDSIARNFSDIKYDNFRIESGNFGNPGSARNFGLSMATYEWVVFWDSDDFAHVSNIISDLLERGINYNVFIGAYVINHPGVHSEFHNLHEPELNPDDFNPKTLVRNLGLWRMTFRTDRIKGISFPPISMAEDKVFFASLSLANSEICLSTKKYYEYSVGSLQSLTRNKRAINDLQKAIKVLETQHPKGDSRSLFAKQLLRQLSLTSIKNGNLKLKLFGIRTLVVTLRDK